MALKIIACFYTFLGLLVTFLQKTRFSKWPLFLKIAHHRDAYSTDDFYALKNQIHHRDPEDAGNSIFNSVWSSMVVLNFILITEVACQCFDRNYRLCFHVSSRVLHKSLDLPNIFQTTDTFVT